MSCPASLGVIATKSMRRRLRAFVAVVALLFLSVIETAHADLISNGSFEIPILPPSSNSSIPGGSTFITGWTVLGNNVSLTTSPFAEGPILLNPQSGNQFVDVSGFLNTPIDGIEQIVPTLGGQEYTLSFYVGRADSLDPTRAIIDLSIDGGPRVSFANFGLSPGMIDWQFFSYNFTASGANTSLAFFNGIPIGEGVLAGLDNVKLELTVVPEPTMPVLFGIGLLSLVACARQVRWKTPQTSARSD